MEFNKKAQGKVVWVIIVMLVAVVTLILVLMFFNKGMGKGESGLFSCEGKGGQCITKSGTCTSVCEDQNKIVNSMLSCSEDNMCCCIDTN